MFCICPEHMNELFMVLGAAVPAIGVAVAWVRARLRAHQHSASCGHGHSGGRGDEP